MSPFVRLLICFACFHAVLKSSAQSIPSHPNKEDSLGRQGTWTVLFDKNWQIIDNPESVEYYRIITYQDDKPVGIVRDYYRSGQIQMEGAMTHDRPEEMVGLVTYYYPDGTVQNAEYYLGEKSLSEVIAEFKQLDLNTLDSKTILSFANFFHQNRLKEARPLYERYVKLVKSELGDQSIVYADALRMLAWDYLRHLDFIQAEPLFFQAKKIIDKYEATDIRLFIQIRNDIGDYLTYIDRHQDALDYFNEAREKATTHLGADDYLIFVILHNSASCYRSIGDYQQAAELSEQVVRDCYSRFGQFHRETANALKGLSFAYSGLGENIKAKKTMEEALTIYSQLFGDWHPEYLDVQYQIGIFHVEMLQLDKASQIFLEVYNKFQQMYGDLHPSTLRAERSYGFALYRMGRKEEAIQILRRSGLHRQVYIQKYFDYMNEEARETLYRQQTGFTYFQSSLAMDARKEHPILISDLLNAQLRNKAILLSTTNAIKKRILESNDRKLIELYNQTQDIRQQLGSYRDLSNEEVWQNHQIDRDSLIEVLENTDRDLNRLSSIYATSQAAPDWKVIRDQLQKEEAYVELHAYREYDLKQWDWTDETRYVALIVTAKTKETPTVILLENGNFLENEAIKVYSNKLKYKLEDRESYKHFWLPLEKELKKYNRILFSADGVFHKVNLATLLNPATGKYLLEEKDIRIITSGRDLLESPRDPSPVKLGMFIGNPSFGELPEGVSGAMRGIELFSTGEERAGIAPLPGAETEVVGISRLLDDHGWKSIVLTNAEAEEAALKDMLKPNILHIATHGFFYQEGAEAANPLHNSGLLFTGAANALTSKEKASTANDGILTSFEAINLNIDNTDLVVLSACETGLGEIRNGEGIYGLQRAFKIAGARTIIMSLWKVDDEATNVLMTRFYENWFSKNMSKREAFISAQQEIQAQYPHPYYWGAFVVLGE